MPSQKTKKFFFRASLLVAFLSFCPLLFSPHAARAQNNGDGGGTNAISPDEARQAFGPRWKEILETYARAEASFLKKQQARLQTSQKISFSKVTKVDDLLNAHPFLRKDVQFLLDDQKTTEGYLRLHPDISLNPSLYIYVAENKDREDKQNLFFMETTGSTYCSAHGCPITIYVGSGKHYTAAMNYIGNDDITVARNNGKISLFFNASSQTPPVEWVLKGGSFVQNPPPPTASQSPAYLQWKRTQAFKDLQQQDQTQTQAPSNNAPPSSGAVNDTIVPPSQ